MSSKKESIPENKIIKRGQSKAKKYEAGSFPSCQRYFVVSEPYYYIRVSSTAENSLFLYPEECGINTCLPEYFTSNYNLAYLLCYLEKGSLVLNIPTGTYYLHDGDCYFIDMSRPHIYYNNSNENNTMIFFHIGGPEAKRYYEYITQRADTNVFHPNEEFVNDFRHLVIRCCTKPNADPLDVSARIISLLSKLDTAPSENAEHIHSVLNYIQEHYNEHISLDTLCSASNLSKSSLIKRFKSSFGYTPHQYILNTRLAMAHHKLISSPLSIDEIAYSVGFNSSAAFIEAFKRKYGTSPGKIRAAAKESMDAIQ